MKLVIATDDMLPVVEHLAKRLRERGHEATVLPKASWGAVAADAATKVASGEFDQGIVCCWTGTGASIAANKVRGIRAALCTDAPTAAGARTWNDANVLVMGLRLTSADVAQEMLDAWFATEPDPGEADNIARLDSTTS